MDCRLFSRNHLAYLDDTLPGVQMAEMREHMLECRRCARQDAAVRRSLLLLRNVPTIRPSQGFNERLQQRLSMEAARSRRTDTTFRGPSLAVFAGTAASVVTLGALGAMFFGAPGNAQVSYPPRLPAVVAYPAVVIDGPSESISMPAFVASMSTGMPVWPALLLADEGSVRFATAELDANTWSSVRPHD
ncbi:MAG TPA: zf-HC2 domain-containing protein [Gemmatimonadaceae bacterium]|nr:zf-HC2 domain-containing protein [Gemmatimonadaceae bacterium]